MTTQHTPGPWALSKDGNSERKNQANCIQGADGTLIVYGQANDADARLIAAAPDLLEALRDVLKWFVGPDLSGWDAGSSVDKSIKAIKKATGSTE